MTPNLSEAGTAPLPAEPGMHAYGRFNRRFAAMFVDALVILGGLFFGGVGLALAVIALGVEIGNLGAAALPLAVALTAGVLLYEPLLVSRTGGTLGHHLLNLRVVPDEENGHLPFRWSVLRTVVKGVMGFPSFVVMAISGRSQALHDAISGSTVQIKDIRRARPGDYTTDRPAHEVSDVSRWRRFAAICAFMPLIWIAGSLYSRMFLPEACSVEGVCTAAEYALRLLGSGMLTVVGGVLVYLGWEGRLPGARSAQVRPLRPSLLRRWLGKGDPPGMEPILAAEPGEPPLEVRSARADA